MPAIVPATTTVCAVEIATLSAALRIGLGVAETALLFACFHLGYLFADPLRRRVAVGTSAMMPSGVKSLIESYGMRLIIAGLIV